VAGRLFCISVSESLVNKVREYIRNQEEHQKRKLFSRNMTISLRSEAFQKFKESFIKVRLYDWAKALMV
jgi:hypothetical protein